MLGLALATQDSGSSATIMVVVVAAALFYLVASWRIYTKAGEPGWAAIVPIVSTFYLLKIVGRPFWWFFVFLIPFAGTVFGIVALHDLSRSFGHGGWFTTGLLFLPFIFWPVLAFSGARYVGPTAAAIRA
jgi:Family of unknown function (DUF5684)